MIFKKLPSVVALAISFQLIVAPVPAMAETGIASAIVNGLNLGKELYDTTRAAPAQQGSPINPQDAAGFASNRTPKPDKSFNLTEMQKIPGLMEYIANNNKMASKTGAALINPAALDCATADTKLYPADPQICRDGAVNPLRGDPKLQAQEGIAYYNAYKQISVQYKNYLDPSQVEYERYGIGCMMNAKKILGGFFDERGKQLDMVVKELESSMAKFEEQSEKDLMSIRESTAILNGEGSPFATEFAKSNIFDYGARIGDAACESIMPKSSIDKMGKTSGLLSIEKKFTEDFSATPPGARYSFESYSASNADVIRDIKKMAEQAATYVTANGKRFADPALINDLKELNGIDTSSTGAEETLKKFDFSGFRIENTKMSTELNSRVKLLTDELGDRGADVISKLSDPNYNIDADLGSLEKQIKVDCIQRSNYTTALGRIYDTQLSQQANKHTISQISSKVKKVMEDATITPQERIAQLKKLEQQSSSSLQMRAEADYSSSVLSKDGKVETKTVKAAGKIGLSDYFTDVINNCETQFHVNKLKNKVTAKEAIKQLGTLKADYAKDVRKSASVLKDEIIKKLVDCKGDAKAANSTNVGSCNQSMLVMENPNFCAKAANSCSLNMKHCTEKVQASVKKITGDRLQRTNTYNNNVEAQRKLMVGLFDGAFERFTQEANALRGAYHIGMDIPKDIERDIKTDKVYRADFLGNTGDALKIKDPKQYLIMVKANIEKLRKSVLEQQQAILKDPFEKTLADAKANFDKVSRDAEAASKPCLDAYNSYSKWVTDQKMASDKAAKETSEKTGEICGLYSDIMSSNPNGACDQNIRSLATAAVNSAKMAGRDISSEANQMINDMNTRCAMVGAKADSAEDICTDENRPNRFDKYFNKKYQPSEAFKAAHKGSNNYADFACQAITSGISNELCSDPAPVSVTNKTKTVPTGYDPKCVLEYDTDSKKYAGECMPLARDCTKLEGAIKSYYKAAANSATMDDSTQTSRVPSFCQSSNNSTGNPKSDLLKALTEKNPLGSTAQKQ